jgi:hypothetical protein
MAPTNNTDQLEIALGLVYDAITLSNRAMRSNPSKEEKRKLIKRRARLEVERADLEGILEALADGKDIDVTPPSVEQVEAIKTLVAAVEEQRRLDVAVSETFELAGKVLDLATELTGG